VIEDDVGGSSRCTGMSLEVGHRWYHASLDHKFSSSNSQLDV
jgi:hypothetical protein